MSKLSDHIRKLAYEEFDIPGIAKYYRENVIVHFREIGLGIYVFKDTRIRATRITDLPEISIHFNDLSGITFEDVKILNGYFGQFMYKLRIHFTSSLLYPDMIGIDCFSDWDYIRNMTKNIIAEKGLMPLYCTIGENLERLVFGDIKIDKERYSFIAKLISQDDTPLVSIREKKYIKIYPALTKVIHELEEFDDEYESDLYVFSWI